MDLPALSVPLRSAVWMCVCPKEDKMKQKCLTDKGGIHLISILLYCFQVCCCICCKWFTLWKFILVILVVLVFLTSQIAYLPLRKKLCDHDKHTTTWWTILFCWEMDHENNSSNQFYDSLAQRFFLFWVKERLCILRPFINKWHSQNVSKYPELLFKLLGFMTFISITVLSNSK